MWGGVAMAHYVIAGSQLSWSRHVPGHPWLRAC